MTRPDEPIAVLTPGVDYTVRCRWKHPDGRRLILVGDCLHVAGYKGRYQPVGRFTDEAAVGYARQSGFRRIGRDNWGFRDDVYNPIRRTLFADVKNTPRDLLASAAARCPPVSSLIELKGYRTYFLKLLVHRLRARKAGVFDMRSAHAKEFRRTGKEKKTPPLPDWLRVAGCAHCGKTVCSPDQPELPPVNGEKILKRLAHTRRLPPQLRRFRGRPYCPKCFYSPEVRQTARGA